MQQPIRSIPSVQQALQKAFSFGNWAQPGLSDTGQLAGVSSRTQEVSSVSRQATGEVHTVSPCPLPGNGGLASVYLAVASSRSRLETLRNVSAAAAPVSEIRDECGQVGGYLTCETGTGLPLLI